jgi:signal transduction histidine kinase
MKRRLVETEMLKEPAVESIPIRRESVDVGVLLELTTEVMERQARALGVTFAIRIDDDVPDAARLDRDKVAWAITSLVGSALRHVRKPGGSVGVHVGYDGARPSLSIAVRDDGPGISSERLDRLLHRGAWQPGGALALLLVDDIARAHGGGVKIESRTGGSDHFTVVSFTIPLEPGKTR